MDSYSLAKMHCGEYSWVPEYREVELNSIRGLKNSQALFYLTLGPETHEVKLSVMCWPHTMAFYLYICTYIKFI